MFSSPSRHTLSNSLRNIPLDTINTAQMWPRKKKKEAGQAFRHTSPGRSNIDIVFPFRGSILHDNQNFILVPDLVVVSFLFVVGKSRDP